MLACEIAGRAVQNRDDLVRRKGDRVRETWLAVIELDEIERRIVEDDAAEHVAVGEKAKIILGEGSDPIAIVDVEICERSLETGHRRWRNIEAGSPGSCLLRLDVRCITKQRRSEEHTSELQSLMRNSYAVFCLKGTATTEYYPDCHTLSLNDVLPISSSSGGMSRTTPPNTSRLVRKRR